MQNKRLLLGAAALLVIGLTAGANASTQTTTFQVTATVNNSCSVTANNIAFGTYNPLLGTPLGVTGGVNVTCTLGTGYQIGLNAGVASGATVTTRKMTSTTNSSDLLSYGLYQDLLHTTNWGNTLNTDTVSGVGTGLQITSLVYANLPASQSVPTGNYADTITVTVTY